MAAALVRHDELIADAVEARGGSLIKSMGEGDSTVSVFESAPHAVEAALAANRALAAEQWPPGIRIAVRWGIHTGEAERRDADYFGPSVNLAARVRAQADGDEVLLSSVTSGARRRAPARGLLARRPRPAPPQGPRRARADLRAGGPGRQTPPPVTDCPYRGLLSFEAGDERFFFGREAVVADLVARVAGGELLAVVGASGSGKSSVLRAGLVAAARAGRIAGVDDAVRRDAGRRRRARRARPAGDAAGRRPVRGAVRRCATTPPVAPPSSTRCWRGAGASRSACGPMSTGASARTPPSPPRSPPTRCCSAR